MAQTYNMGTDEQQAYFDNYPIPPRGYSFIEPGIVTADSNDFVAYQIAKSFYQVHPEVFNIPYIAKATGLKPDDITKRITRMYRDNEFMLVQNPAVEIQGFGLYYWVVKLRDDVTPEKRAELTEWFQENDQICTGYPMDAGGDFDYFNGNHMRNIDNLLGGVIDQFRSRPEVEYVHICPIRRLIRESHVNQFDCTGPFRGYFWGEDARKNVLKYQDKMDKHDFAIIEAINGCASIADMFDYAVLAELSGLDAEEMKENLVRVVDKERTMLPMVYFNYRAVGLKMHFFLVSLFQNTPTWRSEQICDEFEQDPTFVNIFDFGDAHHNYMLSVYEDITDVEAIREKILGYGEVTELTEASSSRQFRRWTCRLDGEHGLWEECVMTDDILLDRSRRDEWIYPCWAAKDGALREGEEE